MGEDLPARRRARRRRDLLGVDGDDDALAAELLRRGVDEAPVGDGGGIDRRLVGAGEQQVADVVELAHAAADRQRHEADFGGAADDVDQRAAVLVAGGDVEEAQFVGAGLVVGDGAFDRIAGVAQVDELDALDDAAVLDVEAGDDAGLKHGRPPPSGSAPAPRCGVEPAVVERAAGDRAGEPRAIGFEQAADILDRGEPARGDDRDRDRLGERDGRGDVEALHHAVAADVGVDQRRDAGVLETAAEVDRRDVGGARPAVDGDAAVARVDADGDAAGKQPRSLAHESRGPRPRRCR